MADDTIYTHTHIFIITNRDVGLCLALSGLVGHFAMQKCVVLRPPQLVRFTWLILAIHSEQR